MREKDKMMNTTFKYTSHSFLMFVHWDTEGKSTISILSLVSCTKGLLKANGF